MPLLSTRELFWSFINERHQIYLNREANKPWPWTTDPILQKYKFTNVFRELDKTTVWLRKHIREPFYNDCGKLLFNIAVFRMYGSIESGIEHGYYRSWNPARIIREDLARLAKGERVFTGAYVITNAGQRRPKVELVVEDFLSPIWEAKDHLYHYCRQSQNLEAVWETLLHYPGWGGGGFMAYELVTDLRHTPILSDATDIMTWANAGPGAIRGLNRYFGRRVNRRETIRIPRAQALDEMRRLLKVSRGHLGSHVPPLEMRDIEHSLCEFDKYMRVKLGEGAPRSLYHRAER